MDEHIKKRHNVSLLLYHIVCPAKYRRVIFDKDEIENTLKDICYEIEKRYEIRFIEIGTDDDHVHFLVQSIPNYSPKKIVQTIKSITAREMFIRQPSVKKKLWGGEFWSKGYYMSTVGYKGDLNAMKRYIQNQGTGKNYKPLFQQSLDL